MVGPFFRITRLDRLARSVLDLFQITAEIAAKKVDLVDQNIDTGTARHPVSVSLASLICS